MNKEQSISSIMKAILNVQQQAEAIKKNTTGQVGTRQYKYANLNDTWESVKQLLKNEGIVVYSSPVYSAPGSSVGNFFKTTLYHTGSGESLTEHMPMVLTKQDPQGVGAAITYYRRYMLQTMLGLIPDDDNDAREQRLATYEQKKKIVGAVKLSFANGEDMTPEAINQTIENIIGKHPSQIREDEADNVIDLIMSYEDKKN